MALTQVEKNRRYREKLKQKAAAGDADAAKKISAEKNKQPSRAAKSYLKNHATMEEIAIFRKILDEREKKLKK
ncbi:hypothetical protein PUW59_05240 [Lactobacillus mulieris]|nr:hypothetical protein PUW59_05240 [Lactobacillus mulieris]